tara:strand:- start:1742 stop:2896 length:1155 start_codon:yes stop_codon:yes gene_type:complete
MGLLKTGKKKKAKRPMGSIQAHMIGEEPEFDHPILDRNDSELLKAYNWYTYTSDSKVSKKWILAYLRADKRTPAFIKNVTYGHPQFFQTTIGAIARMRSRGVELPVETMQWFDERIDKIAEDGKPKASAAAKASRNTSKVYKPSIQERMAENLGEVIGEFDGMEDQMAIDPNFTVPDFYSWLKERNIAHAHVNKLVDYYQPKYDEMKEVQKRGTDSQLVEAYASFSAHEKDMMGKFYQQLMEDLTAYNTFKSKARKIRQKKPPSKDKIVAKLRFKIEDNQFKISSIDPSDIIGAQTLWIFNTKTRKLGRYDAEENSVLGVKGSTITGFNEKTSIAKTLRKPPEQLKKVQAGGKIVLRKLMEEIKTVDIKLNGRINADTVLLRVQ